MQEIVVLSVVLECRFACPSRLVEEVAHDALSLQRIPADDLRIDHNVLRHKTQQCVLVSEIYTQVERRSPTSDVGPVSCVGSYFIELHLRRRMQPQKFRPKSTRSSARLRKASAEDLGW
jgi:hypothetical protein